MNRNQTSRAAIIAIMAVMIAVVAVLTFAVKFPVAATGGSEVWVTHGQDDALEHWCRTRGLKARPLAIVGYGEEDESDGPPPGPPGNGGAMEQ